MNHLLVEISWTSLWRILAMAGLVLAAYLSRDAIIILLLAMFISSIADSLVDNLETRRVPRILGTIIVFFLALLILSLIIYAVLPIAILELTGLFNNFGDVVGEILKSDAPNKLINLVNLDLNNLADILLSGSASVLGILGKLIGGVKSFIAVFVLSFYLTASRGGVERFLRAVFPGNMENNVLILYNRAKKKISKWFEAQLFLGLIIGVVTFIGLSLLGVKYSLILAIIAGVLEIIPMVGPVFAGAISIIVALSQSSALGFYVLILFIIIQQVENHTLVPLVMRKAIDMHPAITLIALLIGVQIAGFAGMLLAVPVTVVAREIMDDWASQKQRNREGL